MNDFAPPSGPPPPHAPEVPAGWAARWNDQYKEWFYVNVYTKQSQWERPTAPVFPVGDNAYHDPPPVYEPGHTPALTDTKKNPYEAPVSSDHHGGSSTMDEDAKLAAKLQAEEDAKARTNPGGPQPPAGYGGPNSYQSQGGNAYSQSPSPYPQGNSSRPPEQFPQDLPARDKGKGGLLGKLFGGKGKMPMGGSQGGYSQGGYGGYSPQPQQGYYQSPPPQQYGGYPNQGPPMGGYGGGYGAPGGYQGGYGGQPGYAQQPQKKPGMGGMGMAGAALGVGGGLLGGALLANAVHHHHEHEEQEAYMDGYQDAQNDDFGGGDYGGDFGGDDF
ncbi:hypothetical protein HIM_03408 [Hirsutella minnesotensis 3608]|uniref:WW domain-containing protein n=1 Tax=Hirsutella minnesotensis 3608 TaxID=1043627 RepID=A0A0F8A2L4_9HYPO|nr:hypothetical protein HIM_03408 [Hirsutella minnesotensis 3608]